MENIISEGKAKLKVYAGKISKKLPVFYNPEMKLNRDISVLLLNAVEDKGLKIALPLAGSGVRGIRFLLELDSEKVNGIVLNDASVEAVESVKKNLELNQIILNDNLIISNREANKFLLDSTGFNYIDIDPFGSPNPFLDVAVKRISRNGILAVTATDTAPLCGTYPKTCIRKYWAQPLKNELKHEVGLRILIRKVQLIGAQYDKALVPMLAYWNLHYFRLFFRCLKGKNKVDTVLAQHGCYDGAGPMWLGSLFDKQLMMKIESGDDFVQLLKNESQIEIPFFYDVHILCKKNKLNVPDFDSIKMRIFENGYRVTSTHFSPYGLKTDIPKDEFLIILKSLQ